MSNILDYLDWRGDLSFDNAPFCEVDHLIFAELSYLPFDGIAPSGFTTSISFATAVNRFLTKNAGKKISLGAIIPDDILRLAIKAKDSKRFGGLSVTGYRNRIDLPCEQQFSAMTFLYGDAFAYCSFRGTDDTSVGWKEDLNMSFISDLPSQRMAAEYVSMAEEMLNVRHFYFGGHSKGGNFAIYAAVRGSDRVREKLISAFGGDSPGFLDDFVGSDDYLEALPKMMHFVPTESVVGMTLSQENFVPVESVKSGIFQHDGFSWKVMGDHFIHPAEFPETARRNARVIRQWIEEMTENDREDMSAVIYDFLTAGGTYQTLTDVSADKLAVLKNYRKYSAEQKKNIVKWLKKLSEISRSERKTGEVKS